MKSSITNSIIDDLTSSYGLDISQEIESILIDELTKSINEDILENIFGDKYKAEILRKKKVKERKDKLNEIFGDESNIN